MTLESLELRPPVGPLHPARHADRLLSVVAARAETGLRGFKVGCPGCWLGPLKTHLTSLSSCKGLGLGLVRVRVRVGLVGVRVRVGLARAWARVGLVRVRI